MSKKPDKTEADAPKGRSKLKLVLFALVPLAVAGGGGYAGWTMFMAGDAVAAADPHAPAPDPVKVSAVPTEIAAETSFTHSFALATIIAKDCGTVRMGALKAASDEEALTDGMLATLSWQAAARRTAVLDEATCRRFRYEVSSANAKAEAIAEARAAEKH
jgi:hypothetical protein